MTRNARGSCTWWTEEDDGSESEYYLRFEITPYSPRTWDDPGCEASLEDFLVECWVYHDRKIVDKGEMKSLGEWLEAVLNDNPDSPLRDKIIRYCFGQLAEMARDGDD